jgi:hypothetical protein
MPDEKTWSCKQCPASYTKEVNLRAHQAAKHPAVMLGRVSTRELLEELRLRGDLAMVALPATPRGQDGAFLSSWVSLLLRGCEKETLDASRGA